jgi:hypothetical protein
MIPFLPHQEIRQHAALGGAERCHTGRARRPALRVLGQLGLQQFGGLRAVGLQDG